jgi:hypothetical protein
VTLAQLVGTETKALHGAGPEILHQDVGLRDQFGEDLTTDRAFYVDRKRALTAVRGNKQRRKLSCLVDCGAASAGNITADRLDLEHVGALICQEHGCERAPSNRGHEHR